MTAAAVVAVALVGFMLFLFVLKRVLRMAIRLAGAGAWWWYGPSGDAPAGSAPARGPRKAR